MNDLEPKAVSQMLLKEGVQLVDVRQPEEHEAGRIARSILIELERLPAEAGTLDRDRPLVFYCRSGSRSALATQAFADAGFDAHNLGGGLLAWVAAGLPIEPDGGYVD